MAKAKQTENGDGFTNQSIYTDELLTIELDKIHPSPLEPQAKRRARTTPEDLAELASSISKHGLINPITVRPNDDGFEIVAGERRWMATRQAGLASIRAIVKDLSDADAEEIQLSENLDRQDLHPLDEAFWYKHLMAKPNATLTDVAIRVGKSESHVHRYLKLNDLCDQAMKDFADGHLPIGHAMEIAKYPLEIQSEVLCYSWKNGRKDEGVDSFQSLKEKIERGVLKLFKQAPFSIKAKDLRPDGLACVDCKERAGYSPTLFGNDFNGKNDKCLNKKCWNSKIQEHIQITRQALAEEISKPLNHVPIITDNWYVANDEKPEGKFLKSDEYKLVDSSKPCGKQKMAIYFHGKQIGKTDLICPKTSGCEVHWKSSGSSSYSRETPSPAERSKRKEEIFDVKVAEAVRKRVLKKCAVIFGGNFMAASTTEQGLNRDLFIETLNRMWFFQASQDDKTETVIQGIIGDWVSDAVPSANRWTFESTKNDTLRFLNKLDDSILPRMLFLFLHAYKGAMFYGNWASQKEIKVLAEQYEVDYQLFDAEERLGQAAMKNKDVFRAYLQELEADKRDGKIPRIWSEKWKPKE
jgi:ParB family transcriptional regulator, chromosome partitioning protein